VSLVARYDGIRARGSDTTFELAPEGSRSAWRITLRWAW
jgi:hypothetical protein